MSRQTERPWCDQIAWRAVFENPIPVKKYVRILRAAGVTDAEIMEVSKFLDLKVDDGTIGYEIDFCLNVVRFPGRQRAS